MTAREMALAVWISELSEKVAVNDRHQITMLMATANLLATADDDGEIPQPTKDEERFVLTVKQGCERRGAKRAEAAIACIAVALAAVKVAHGVKQ